MKTYRVNQSLNWSAKVSHGFKSSLLNPLILLSFPILKSLLFLDLLILVSLSFTPTVASRLEKFILFYCLHRPIIGNLAISRTSSLENYRWWSNYLWTIVLYRVSLGIFIICCELFLFFKLWTSALFIFIWDEVGCPKNYSSFVSDWLTKNWLLSFLLDFIIFVSLKTVLRRLILYCYAKS